MVQMSYRPKYWRFTLNLYSTFIQKFIVLQRGYHHARRLNKMNKIKSNDVKKKKISIKDKMDKKNNNNKNN